MFAFLASRATFSAENSSLPAFSSDCILTFGGRCKSYCFVLTLVRENHILVRENYILVREKSGNFTVDLLCEPCFVVVIFMCLLYVSLGSRVSSSIFGLMFMGSMMLSICSSSCVLYSAGSGVHVVLSGLRMRLFVRVHVCISCRYDLMFALAMFMSYCVDVMVMSSA